MVKDIHPPKDIIYQLGGKKLINHSMFHALFFFGPSSQFKHKTTIKYHLGLRSSICILFSSCFMFWVNMQTTYDNLSKPYNELPVGFCLTSPTMAWTDLWIYDSLLRLGIFKFGLSLCQKWQIKINQADCDKSQTQMFSQSTLNHIETCFCCNTREIITPKQRILETE